MTNQSSVDFAPKLRVALLVDGENLSHSHAGTLILKSAKYGALIIKRVYGNMTKLHSWDDAPGFKTIHAGSGKNAADLLLAVEAMALMLTAQADVLVIASSDGDFSHLAQHLTERGLWIVGIGEAKAPPKFRKSCSNFHDIDTTPSAAATLPALLKPASPLPAQSGANPTSVAPQTVVKISRRVTDFLKVHADAKGYPIAQLGGQMHKQHGIKISVEPEKNWRAFLLKRTAQFDCDPKGRDACVRLRQ